jgi:hypothetical protein
MAARGAAVGRWLVLAGALGGCAFQGAIAGRLEGRGMQPQPVTIDYTAQRFGSGGTIRVELPSGEFFTGRYIQVTPDTKADAFGPGGVGWGPWPPGWSDWGGGRSFDTFVEAYSGKVVATLFGDRKNTMRCRFDLTNQADGMAGGGTGQCQITGGDVIQAQF